MGVSAVSRPSSAVREIRYSSSNSSSDKAWRAPQRNRGKQRRPAGASSGTFSGTGVLPQSFEGRTADRAPITLSYEAGIRPLCHSTACRRMSPKTSSRLPAAAVREPASISDPPSSILSAGAASRACPSARTCTLRGRSADALFSG
jgi:hypothetical protein